MLSERRFAETAYGLFTVHPEPDFRVLLDVCRGLGSYCRHMRISIVAGLAALLVGCSNTVAPEQVSPTLSRVQADLDAAVAGGVSGMIATLSIDGREHTRTAGVADRASNAPIPADPAQQVRIGSVSKSFVAAILLQLVADGNVRLDEPVATYLPEALTGFEVTVRQILQHRSGLPEFSGDPEIDEYRAALTGLTMTPADELAIALRHPAQFAPGAKFAYTNTNYLVAAMLIERVSGRAYADVLQDRIIRPLGLVRTYLPGTGDTGIRGPHPKAYATFDGVRTDVTRVEPSIPWAAGAMVSVGAEVNRYFMALLSGAVVPVPLLDEMLATQPMAEGSPMSYGLGIMSADLPCGARYFGHFGGISGFLTVAGATRDGRAVTFTWTESPAQEPDVVALLGRALCP